MAIPRTNNKTYITRVSNMAIDPYVDADMLERYPVLEECIHSRVNEDMMLDKYLRYCALVFDPNSPLVREWPDIAERRKQAAKEIGSIGIGDRKIEVAMLKNIYRSREWTLITSLDNCFDEYAEKVNEIIEMDEPDKLLKAVDTKGKLLSQMREMLITRKALIDELYGGDVGLLEEEAALTPEAVAKLNRK